MQAVGRFFTSWGLDSDFLGRERRQNTEILTFQVRMTSRRPLCLAEGGFDAGVYFGLGELSGDPDAVHDGALV